MEEIRGLKVKKEDIVNVSSMSDSELSSFLKKNLISLKINEVRSLPEKLRRQPTITELHVFNIQWSEHSSYKSSKKWLKLLPTTSSKVILGPKEDSGILELGYIDGERYGIVVSHESHNHPSQVVPYEGAATGIGGDVRDVLCMGAKVIAVADPLRFGDPYGKFKNRTRYIANAVVDGIAGYGNPLGIPNICGDVYFNSSFDDNCLVNVVSLGILKEKDIIHSYAPKNAVGHDVVVVGKATDYSGFGGAAFASLILDDNEQEQNKGAVQVPDPFLKNILLRSSYKVFDELKKNGIIAGFKDMGAGGIMCATSEMGSDSGYGVELDLDKIHVSMNNLPPYVIACSETQERFTWIVPPSFTPKLLKIYNEDFDLPNVAKGARASLVGKITDDKMYRLMHKGEIVCNAPIDEVTKGIGYERSFKEMKLNFSEPVIDEPKDYKEILLKVLHHQNVASKEKIYKHYDLEVQGNAVIRPGEADAGLIAPVRGNSHGVAMSVDCNPRYCKINPYMGAINAVAESMRNVSAIGAIPTALTDCLNYGNPEKAEAFWQFVEGVKGIADAAREIYMYGTKEPVAVISGNVSFYNENAKGSSVDPSPIIACVGVMKDYSKAVTTGFKKKGSALYLIGKRKDELGGSAYYDVLGELGNNIPQIEFSSERNMIHSIIKAIDERMVLSCHDISDGGLGVSLAEMCILGGYGCNVDLSFSELRFDRALFSESSGFVVEVSDKVGFEKVMKEFKVEFFPLGKVGGENMVAVKGNKILNVPVNDMENAWRTGVVEALK